MHFSPGNGKQQHNNKKKKKIPVFPSTKKDDWLLRQLTARHMKTQAGAWGAGIRCAVTAGKHPSSPFHLYYLRFCTETLWGLEQQQSHHTVFKTSSFKSKLLKKKKKNTVPDLS